MPGITREHQRLIDYVEPQGVTWKRTTKGIRFEFPNGGSDEIHFTQSDWRALRNTRANFRRNGIEWPGDAGAHKGKGKGKPRANNLAKAKALIATLDPEQLQKGLTIAEMTRLTDLSFYAAENCLRALHWWKDWGVQGRWHPPLDNPTEVLEEVEGAEEEEPERSADLPEPEPGEPWSVDLASLVVPGLTVEELVGTFAALGMRAELTIWRNKP